jgi:hypothetical protein
LEKQHGICPGGQHVILREYISVVGQPSPIFASRCNLADRSKDIADNAHQRAASSTLHVSEPQATWYLY